MRLPQREAEFTAFVDARRAHLLRTAYLLCGEWHRAEDLTQQALVRLYRAWPRVHDRGGAEAYVRRTLMSSHIDDWRWRNRRPETSVAEHSEQALQVEANPDDREVLRAALLQLSEGQRKVVVLRFWLDMSVEETAADLGISTGTVKSQSVRALSRLHSLVSDDFPVRKAR